MSDSCAVVGGGSGNSNGNGTNDAADGSGGSGTVRKVTADRKNYPGNRSDLGWTHGTDVDGNGKKVKCKYCTKIVTGGIYRFKHHLAGTKNDVEPCVSTPDQVRVDMLQVLFNGKAVNAKRKKQWSDLGDEDEEGDVTGDGQNKGKVSEGLMMNFLKQSRSNSGGGGSQQQTTINHAYKKDLREDACQQIARFFYTSAIPFNCVKNPEFSKMCDLIGRYGVGLKPPSYHEVREKYLKKEKMSVDNMIKEYENEWKKTGCTIMSDGWTDRKRRSICNFLVNSPKGTVFLYSLDTSDISKTADKVFEMLDKVVQRVGEENVVQIITDNAANYKAAGMKLMEKRKHLYWTPCAAHCIDLMLEDFEKHIMLHKDTIAKGRKITTYIYSRTPLISLLKNFTNGRDLIRPGATRFATSYLTLACLNEHKVALITLFSSNEWKDMKYASTRDGKQVARGVLDNEFWKDIVMCLKAAAPLIKVLRLVDSEEKPAMGFIYREMDRAKDKIKGNFNNVKKNFEEVWKIIDDRWSSQMHRPLHAAAYYLNPAIHYSSEFKDDYQVKEGLYSCLSRMVTNREVRAQIEKELQDFDNARGFFGYETAQINKDKMAPAEWWNAYGDGCPELKKIAIRILSLTTSSSGCERNWSAFEWIHTKKRNRLHQKKMNDLAFVMCNLKLKGKKESRKPQFEFEDINSDDEWITEEYEGGGSNVELEHEDDDQGLHGGGTGASIVGNSFMGDNGSEHNVGNEGDYEIGDDVGFEELC